jgi:hypothetical protein
MIVMIVRNHIADVIYHSQLSIEIDGKPPKPAGKPRNPADTKYAME